MRDTSSFVAAGLRALREEMADLGFVAGLSSGEGGLGRRLYAQLRARLILIETLLRRLLILMAASINTPIIPAKAGTSCSNTAPSQPPSAPSHPKHPRRRSFPLLPRLRERTPPGSDVFALLSVEHSGPPGSFRSKTPLVHRYCTIMGVLRRPERAARRMAFTLARLRAAGAPRPLCLTPLNLKRAGEEISLIAATLPERVARALVGWYDTG
ncbi:hypothetical protein [Henriciella marina]|uniref:Uncharacterized protein n=1 Tax=Henriciella marina TaxID=453851 RepID=A0ABT4LXF5_9PROT|nr:hypothetical protein [Henriciella marina]MCZ4298808.1 hypothetical protein [Henriciella marina]